MGNRVDLITKLNDLLRRLAHRNATDPNPPPDPHDQPGDPVGGMDSLTDTNRAALNDYTTNDGYQTMNPYLRNPDGYPPDEAAEVQARADRVSDALARLLAQPGTTYRGVEYPDDILARYEPGQIVTEHAFTSTSRDPNVARGAFDGNTIMIITGRNGRNIKLWDAGMGKWVITLEEVRR